jgi:hypothetical protein
MILQALEKLKYFFGMASETAIKILCGREKLPVDAS